MSLMPRLLQTVFRALYLPLLLALGLVSVSAQEPVSDAKTAAEKKLADTQSRLKKLSASEYELDGIKINATTREVRIPTKVELQKAPLEYLLVHETGKTHETVLTTAINPMAIQVALLLANYQPATEGMLAKVPEKERPTVWKEEPPKTPGGNRLKIDVEWKEGDKVKKAPLVDFVQFGDTGKPPVDLTYWIFNGSFLDERGFVGEHEGSVIALWLDRAALINSPAEGAWRDDLWISLPKNIPEIGTPVTLIISPTQP